MAQFRMMRKGEMRFHAVVAYERIMESDCTRFPEADKVDLVNFTDANVCVAVARATKDRDSVPRDWVGSLGQA